MFKYLLCSAILSLLSLAGTPQTVPEATADDLKNTAAQVMQKVRERARESDRIKHASLQCAKSAIEENLQKQELEPGRTKSTKTFRIFGKNSKVMQQLITKNGKDVKNAREEQEPVDTGEALLDRYEYELVDLPDDPATVLLDGRAHYVIRFKSKEGLPFKIREDQLLNRVSGKMYIDAGKSFIRKAVGKTRYQITRGLFGSVTVTVNGAVEMEQEELGNAIVMKMARFSYRYESWIDDGHNQETVIYSECSVSLPPAE